MRFLVLFSGVLLFSTPAFASGWQKFCAGVPDWPKGSEVPSDDQYKGLATPVDAAFVKSKWEATRAGESGAEKWVVIDARAKEDRAVGKVPGSALIISDYHDATLHQFDERTVVKKVSKALKAKGKYKSLADMQDVRFVVFCNGRKCHRSTFGACSLRQLGVPEDRIFLMLGGFPDWKERGYPVR